MRSVVVTGSSTGIGRATALHLDRRGFLVFAGVRKDADGEALQKEASDRLHPVLIDVTDQATIDAAAKTVAEAADGRLAGLVNNAGITVAGPLEYLPVGQIRRQFEVNVFGQLAVTQAFLPLIREGRGRIVFMSSIGGRRPAMPFLSPYQASKHALEAFGDALRVELAPWGIEVVLIEPGSIATPIWDKGVTSADRMVDEFPPEAAERYGVAAAKARKLAETTGKRGIPPERVAEKVGQALLAKRPKPRYLVGADAVVQNVAFSVMPDRVRDRVFGRLIGGKRKSP
jgi:NAD(P)-dependent dehydrogenase (short-subunit alcohol dehydrogenase family)